MKSPADHLLRRIDQLIDFSEVRAELAPYYSAAGRPSICPELMIRMLVAGYCFGIRSEHHLCDEVHLNLAYRWFCRLAPSRPRLSCIRSDELWTYSHRFAA